MEAVRVRQSCHFELPSAKPRDYDNAIARQLLPGWVVLSATCADSWLGAAIGSAIITGAPVISAPVIRAPVIRAPVSGATIPSAAISGTAINGIYLYVAGRCRLNVGVWRFGGWRQV